MILRRLTVRVTQVNRIAEAHTRSIEGTQQFRSDAQAAGPTADPGHAMTSWNRTFLR